MYCHFSWRRSISPWNLARKISLVLLLIYIHLQIFPIPITNINREIESRDSISIFHSIIPQISNFSTLGRRSKPEESGIKFFFSAPKDGDNNKQRIRREAKFLFPYPLPSSVQPRRARIYASKRITMGRGGKKKRKKGREEGVGGKQLNWEVFRISLSHLSILETHYLGAAINLETSPGRQLRPERHKSNFQRSNLGILFTNYSGIRAPDRAPTEFSPRPFSSTPREIR